MLITFAVPREINGTKYSPDQTAELPNTVARTLIQDGHARRPTEKDLARAKAEKAEPHGPQTPAAIDPPGTPAQSTTDKPDAGRSKKE